MNDFELLNDIGIALSAEHDMDALLQMVLEKAISMANADAGIIFVRHPLEDDAYVQHASYCKSLKIKLGGTTGEPTYAPPVELHDSKGRTRMESITVTAAINRQSVNIANIYEHDSFDFSSTKAFDKRLNYKTQSVLAVPMITKRREVIGIIRLSNAQDSHGTIQPFSREAQHMVESLASQAAVALDNDLLITGLEDLFEAFIQLVAKAIDNKSTHTGNHLQRIPVIVEMLANAAIKDDKTYADFQMDKDALYELRIAAWLHDCGKLSTPDYILEKATKLSTFFDRIELIETRLELLARDAEIAMLKGQLSAADYQQRLIELTQASEFFAQLNQGMERVPDEWLARLEQFANRHSWTPKLTQNSKKQPFFTDDEYENLSVKRGTLTADNRKIIEDHILHSIEMLERMPFPRQLKRVPEYAGAHHERMDGKGYPNGLTGDEMSLPARMMAVADVFEALTSHDRPYKQPKTLSESREIMTNMAAGGGIDPELNALLWRSEFVAHYAKRYLLPEQIDL